MGRQQKFWAAGELRELGGLILKWGGLALLAMIVATAALDALGPQFWVEYRTRLEEEREQREAHEAEEARRAELRERLRADLEREKEARKKRAPERAVSGSVLDGHVLRVEGFSGTLELTLTPEFTTAWEMAGCDAQRANLSILFRKWKYQYGDTAHTVTVRSWSGREIGEYSSLWGYHCG